MDSSTADSLSAISKAQIYFGLFFARYFLNRYIAQIIKPLVYSPCSDQDNAPFQLLITVLCLLITKKPHFSGAAHPLL